WFLCHQKQNAPVRRPILFDQKEPQRSVHPDRESRRQTGSPCPPCPTSPKVCPLSHQFSHCLRCIRLGQQVCTHCIRSASWRWCWPYPCSQYLFGLTLRQS